ncbi:MULTISPECIES: hypothetical protein [Streptomyces]|nr:MULTISPECIES: hypothetical protein [Streptomyces]GGW04357.1 hypothetical protein GCM10010264_21070 [Streptomyces globisporus]
MTLAPDGGLISGHLDVRLQLHLPVAALRLTLATTPGTLLAARALP